MSKFLHKLSGKSSKSKLKGGKQTGHSSANTLESDHPCVNSSPMYADIGDIQTDSVPVDDEGHSGGSYDDISQPGINELIRQRGELDSGFASSQRASIQSDLHKLQASCQKHPTHGSFIPIRYFSEEHLPSGFRSSNLKRLIQLWGQFIVRLVISFTNTDRPESVAINGNPDERTGSGVAFLFNMKEKEPCNCKEVEGNHYVSGRFKVLTAAHVIYDDREAEKTVIEFFFDGENREGIVKAKGEVVSVDVDNNRSIVECRTHDLTLYERLAKAQREIETLNKNASEQVANGQSQAVLISHPHGASKHVSIGRLRQIKPSGHIQKTKEGVELVDCNLSYDTPTCAGAGGGAVHVIRSGKMISAAFAPHCASKTSGENISGLGWARVMGTWPWSTTY